MKTNLRIIAVVIGAFMLGHSMVASAVEVAPRISDREIIEALVELRGTLKAQEQKTEQQFKAQEQKTEQQFKAQEQKTEQQFKAMDQKIELKFQAVDQKIELKFQTVDQQISSLTNMLLTFFGAIVSLIVALFGYIAWDRRTMVKPLEERMERIEFELHRDLEIQHPEGSRITRFINALRDLTESDERVAVVLRAHALL